MPAQTAPLFKPFDLKALSLRNRIAMSPMTRGFSPGGVPGRNVADYYRRRAEAGVGLIITEGVGIDHPAAIGSGSLREQAVPMLYGEDAMAGWKAVVDDVHAAGGVIMPQLWHMGVMRRAGTSPSSQVPSSRPSGIWGPAGRHSMAPEYVAELIEPTAPMTEADIADVIAAYGRSAANARAAGFDGIAVHAAHGYLIDTFFWKETNIRTDRYGGDIRGRVQFGAEVVAAIRKAAGPDLPIVFRYSQWKQQDYDARLAETPQELEALLAPLVDAGVDMFDVSTRIFSRPAFEGSDLTLAGWTRKVTGVAAMAVGGVGVSKDLQSGYAGGVASVDNLDEVAVRLEREEFDMIAVGRAMLVDPHWITKVRTGEPFAPFRQEAYAELY
jgi:2,4-dienoyl-CoA reductase-like NADH-dependent reductase (Old Yellow Enzyme family)